MGETTSTETLGFKILPQIGDQTILTVNLYDKDGYKPSGITVTVNFGVDSKSAVASEGYVTFNLGTYTGGVAIATQETDTYKGATASATVKPGQNTVFIQLERKGEERRTILDLILEWLKQNYTAVMAILAVLSVTTIYVSKKR